MPPPVDLTGRRFGKLLVLGPGETQRSPSGKSVYRGWLCRCDCGREETVLQILLPHAPSNARRAVTACSVCRRKQCTVCGASVPLERGKKNTCSDTCEAIKDRGVYLDHYYRKKAVDPELNRRRHAMARERLAADPERLAAHKAVERARDVARWSAKKSDPEAMAAESEKRRAWYAANAERIQAKRRERLNALTPEQYARWAERVREYSSRHYERNKQSPEFLARRKANLREYLRQQALRGLVAAGDELIKRSINDE